MSKGLIFGTSAGFFTILEEAGQYVSYFQGHAFGSYTQAQFAADDLSDGNAPPHQSGIDTSVLGIPYNLAEWRFFEESEQMN